MGTLFGIARSGSILNEQQLELRRQAVAEASRHPNAQLKADAALDDAWLGELEGRAARLRRMRMHLRDAQDRRKGQSPNSPQIFVEGEPALTTHEIANSGRSVARDRRAAPLAPCRDVRPQPQAGAPVAPLYNWSWKVEVTTEVRADAVAVR
jgi:hypothetical protein